MKYRRGTGFMRMPFNFYWFNKKQIEITKDECQALILNVIVQKMKDLLEAGHAEGGREDPFKFSPEDIREWLPFMTAREIEKEINLMEKKGIFARDENGILSIPKEICQQLF